MACCIPPGILEILDRAQSGPVCTEKEWNARILPRKIAEKLKEHDLNKTSDPSNPINTDDGLADEFWRAGFELAAQLGMICLDTNRIIKFTEEEVREAIRASPSEITLGEGLDRITMKARRPEDKTVPIFSSPLGIVVSEDLYIPIMIGIAQCREVDIIRGFSLKTVYGRSIRSGTPYETLAGNLQAKMHQEIIRRANRPGIAAEGAISSPTEYGQFGGYGIVGGYKPTDIAIVLSPAEVKTNYSALHKVVQAINCGGMIQAGSMTMIGGYAGSPEGSVLAAMAFFIISRPVHQALAAGGGIYDLRYFGNTGREALWANSVLYQAVSRNTRLLMHSIINQTAGPCTPDILYESAVGLMDVSVSGASESTGPRSAAGRYTDYVSPLETKFCAEVFKASAGMKRSDANEIAKAILPKYEDRLMNPPKGKSFTECFDLKTLKPTKEWQEIYNSVKREVMDLGIPLELDP